MTYRIGHNGEESTLELNGTEIAVIGANHVREVANLNTMASGKDDNQEDRRRRVRPLEAEDFPA